MSQENTNLEKFLDLIDINVPTLFTNSETGLQTYSLTPNHVLAVLGQFDGFFVKDDFILTPKEAKQIYSLFGNLSFTKNDDMLVITNSEGDGMTKRMLTLEENILSVRDSVLKIISGISVEEYITIPNNKISQLLGYIDLFKGSGFRFNFERENNTTKIFVMSVDKQTGSVKIDHSLRTDKKARVSVGEMLIPTLKAFKGLDINFHDGIRADGTSGSPPIFKVENNNMKVYHVIAPLVD